MSKQVLGHVTCPICGHAHAEVKNDKGGKPFIFCPKFTGGCNIQIFTRTEHQAAMLESRLRPVTVTVTEEKPQPVPVTGGDGKGVPVTGGDDKPIPLPEKPPKKRSAMDDALEVFGVKR